MLNFLLENEPTNWYLIVMLPLVLLVFYFLLIRPEKKRERAAQAMRDALQVGDEVTTIGGIIGKVVSIKEGIFVLETTRDRTRIRFLLNAIRSVDVKAAEAAGTRVRAAGKPEAAQEAAVVEEAVVETPATEDAVAAEETAVVEEAVAEEAVAEETVATEDTDKKD